MEPEKFEQDRVDRCDFLDVLEEAVTVGGTVKVQLKDGRTFDDRIEDVVTEAGREIVIFAHYGRMPVADLASATRSPPPRRRPA